MVIGKTLYFVHSFYPKKAILSLGLLLGKLLLSFILIPLNRRYSPRRGKRVTGVTGVQVLSLSSISVPQRGKGYAPVPRRGTCVAVAFGTGEGVKLPSDL